MAKKIKQKSPTVWKTKVEKVRQVEGPKLQLEKVEEKKSESLQSRNWTAKCTTHSCRELRVVRLGKHFSSCIVIS